MRPEILLVPSQLEFIADQLLNSAELLRDVSTVDQAPSGNPLRQRLTRLTEPRLGSSGYDDFSTTAWFLFTAPQKGAIHAALLNGKDTPTIEQESAPFDYLGLRWRGFIDYGFAFGEPAAAHMATGAS